MPTSTRAQAQRLIGSGVRWLRLSSPTSAEAVWQSVAKNGDIIPDEAEIELLNDAEALTLTNPTSKITQRMFFIS